MKYLCLFLSLIVLSEIQGEMHSRRTFCLNMLAAAAGIVSVPIHLKEAPPPHQKSKEKNYDFETLGLEAFGQTVKDILQDQRIADAKISERIRWHLQERIWKELEKKIDGTKPVEVSVQVAILRPDGKYLLFRPRFRLVPLSREEQEVKKQVLGRVEYISPLSNENIVRYSNAASLPSEKDTLILLGKDEREKDSNNYQDSKK